MLKTISARKYLPILLLLSVLAAIGFRNVQAQTDSHPNYAIVVNPHVPVEDMDAPTQEQLDRCVSAIERANAQGMGVAVHCGAGLGRTGVVLAAYFVAKGTSAQNAIGKVRRLRPGSIETDEQAEAVVEFARRRGQQLKEG